MVTCILDFRRMAVTCQCKNARYVTLQSKILRYHYNLSSCSNKADPNKVFAHDLQLKLALFMVKSLPFVVNIS